MLSNADFLQNFVLIQADNEPAKYLQVFAKYFNFVDLIPIQGRPAVQEARYWLRRSVSEPMSTGVKSGAGCTPGFQAFQNPENSTGVFRGLWIE